MKYFSAYKSSEFSITQKQKRREDLFSLIKKQASPNTLQATSENSNPTPYGYTNGYKIGCTRVYTIQMSVMFPLSCLFLKLAISFLRIKVKNALQRYVFYNTRHLFVGFFCYLYTKGDTNLKFPDFIT